MDRSRKQCLFVIGMHRCGTSALAGSLEKLGYYIGDSVMQPTEFNSKGYFENMAVFHFNEALLAELDATWDNIPNNLKMHSLDHWEEYKSDINQIIEKEYDNRSHILIKDPRISLLTELWYESLTHLGYDCHFFVCYRNPLSVLQSLNFRDSFSYEKSAFLYAQYLKAALENTNEEERSLVSYERLISDKSEFFASLDFIDIDREHVNRRNEIDEFLDKELGHPLDSSIEEMAPNFPMVIYNGLKNGELKSLDGVFSKIKRLKPSFRDIEISRLEHDQEALEAKLFEVISFSQTQELEFVKKSQKDARIKEAQFVAISKQIEQSRNTINVLRIEKDNLLKELNEKIEEIEQHNVSLKESLTQLKEEYISMIELGNMLKEEENMLKEEEIVDQENDIKRLSENISALQQAIHNVQKEKAVQNVSLKADNEELHHLNAELQQVLDLRTQEVLNVKQSISARLGFVISFPFRLVIELVRLINFKTLKLIPTFLSSLIRNPRMAFAALNPRNLEKLRMATAVENTTLTNKNIAKYFEQLNEIQAIGDVNSISEILCKVDEAGIFGDTVIIRGWAIAPEGIEEVAMLNKQEWIPMEYGRNRPDIAIVYPHFINSNKSEFYLKKELAIEEDFIQVRVTSINGEKIAKQVQLKSLKDWSSLELNEQYEEFLKREKARQMSDGQILEEIAKMDFKPKISIIVPVYNVKAKWLRFCIQSVTNQLYSNWELCIYDDASTNIGTLEELKKWEGIDSRIKIEYGVNNVHISESSNIAIDMCEGEYIGLLDHDDELTTDAIFRVVQVLNEHPEIELVYSDEDKKELDGRRVDPHFKSGFNLDLLRSNNYIAHFCVIKKSIGDEVGWFTKGLEGSQDHDLVLKIIDHINNNHIWHIPRVLYHWRKIPGSTAALYDDKDYAFNAGKKAIENHLLRNMLDGSVEKGIWPGSYKVNYTYNNSPKVSIVIPFKDQVHLLKECLRSIKEKTNYKNYEILLINNGSKEASTKTFLNSLSNNSKIRIHDYNIPFNYSKINNWGIRQAKGELVLLLNNDVEVISTSWLTHMTSFFTREDVGAVGAKLLYEDNTIQHAGVILGIGGVAGHSHKYLHNEGPGYFSRHQVIQNLSACTAACLMVRKDLFEKVGGLEEEHLTVAFNDVDLCLKIKEQGKLIIYTPYAELYHYESKSRGQENTPNKLKRFKKEVKYFKKKWERVLAHGDEYYNPNLSLTREDFSLNLDE